MRNNIDCDSNISQGGAPLLQVVASMRITMSTLNSLSGNAKWLKYAFA